jgi:GNAT superfamily N-acetyltransferase
MPRRLVNITLDNLDELPAQCRHCVFWELDPVTGGQVEREGRVAAEKETWVSATLLDWGSCGKVVRVDGTPAGYVLYAPPARVPRSLTFPTSPVSPDAVLLMTARVCPEFAGVGLGRMMVQGVVKDLLRRGVRAVEAFGDARAVPSRDACLMPMDFLLAVGFKTVRPHHAYPRLRLEMKSTVSWREDMEVALERLLGARQPEPVLRPI